MTPYRSVRCSEDPGTAARAAAKIRARSLYLKDPHEFVRASAVYALPSMPPKVDGLIAARLRSDSKSDVRLAAIDAARLRRPSEPLASAVAGAGTRAADPHVRYRAVELMASWLPRRPELRAALVQIARAAGGLPPSGTRYHGIGHSGAGTRHDAGSREPRFLLLRGGRTPSRQGPVDGAATLCSFVTSCPERSYRALRHYFLTALVLGGAILRRCVSWLAAPSSRPRNATCMPP